MESCGGIAPPFMTSALGGVEWSASRPGLLTHVDGGLGSHWIGGHVGPIAGLDAVEKRKISCVCRESNSDSSAVHPVAYR
jgi:hypothetical protein